MIEQLFGSKTRTKLLYLLFQNPERSFYVREMSREIGSQLNAVRREIANLETVGLLAAIEESENSDVNYGSMAGGYRAKFYKLRTDCLLYNELKSLLLKAQIMKEREMVEKLKQKAGKMKLLILTGIFTAANDASTDILLVGEIKPLVLSRLISSFEKKIGKPIRYTLMSVKEFNERREIGDKFLYSIFESKHLVVVDNF